MICCEKLANGITVVFERMEHYRSVALGAWVGAGSVSERENESGVSHFIEHMLFKGTNRRTASEIASETDVLGGNLNAFTAKECTCFYLKVLDEAMGEACDILSDIMLSSKLDPADIEREKGVVTEEIAMTLDSPEDVAHETLCSVIYEGTPLARSILGTEDSVRSFCREDITRYMDEHYRTDNIVLACAGSFDEKKLIDTLNASFGSVPLGGERTSPITRKVTGRHMRTVEKDTEQTHICLGFPGFSIKDERHFALLILNNILGGTMSSRLFQKVREESGLAYSIYSYPTSYAGTGYFTLYAGTNPSTAAEVTRLMLEETENIKKHGVKKAEFDRAKAQLRNGYALGQESTSARAGAIGKAQLLLGAVDTEEALLSRLERVTYQDLSDILPYVLDTDELSVSLVGRAKDESREIEKLILG